MSFHLLPFLLSFVDPLVHQLFGGVVHVISSEPLGLWRSSEWNLCHRRATRLPYGGVAVLEIGRVLGVAIGELFKKSTLESF